MTQPENPPLSPRTRHNVIDVHVDGVPVTTLINTAAQMPVLSSTLHCRLHKVLTPALSAVIHAADAGTPAVVGMCTTHLSITSRHTSILFIVLSQCPHNLIVGTDFLSAHLALIDCATSVVQPEQPLHPLLSPCLQP